MLTRLVTVFFIALGVVIGGTFIGGLSALFTKDSPLKLMDEIAQRIELYAVVSSIGGTFKNLRLLEGSIFQGELSIIIQQVLVLVIGFIGANVGVLIIKGLTGGY